MTEVAEAFSRSGLDLDEAQNPVAPAAPSPQAGPQPVVAAPPPAPPASPWYRLASGALWLVVIGGGLGTLAKRYLVPKLKDWLRDQVLPRFPLRWNIPLFRRRWLAICADFGDQKARCDHHFTCHRQHTRVIAG